MPFFTHGGRFFFQKRIKFKYGTREELFPKKNNNTSQVLLHYQNIFIYIYIYIYISFLIIQISFISGMWNLSIPQFFFISGNVYSLFLLSTRFSSFHPSFFEEIPEMKSSTIAVLFIGCSCFSSDVCWLFFFFRAKGRRYATIFIVVDSRSILLRRRKVNIFIIRKNWIHSSWVGFIDRKNISFTPQHYGDNVEGSLNWCVSCINASTSSIYTAVFRSIDW